MNKKISITIIACAVILVIVICIIYRDDTSKRFDKYNFYTNYKGNVLSSFDKTFTEDSEYESADITGNNIVDAAITKLCTEYSFESFNIAESWTDVNFGCIYYHIIFDDSTLYILCYDIQNNTVGIAEGDYTDYTN